MPISRETDDRRQRPRVPATEPTVRVGIVIESDHHDVVDIQLPDIAEVIDNAHLPAEFLSRGAPLTVRATGKSLSVRVGELETSVASPLRLSCGGREGMASGAGIVVRGVIAGRGFHWAKHLDQMLPGVTEIAPGAAGLVLINELPLEDYLAGVITAEMSGDCPADLLKAQCVVARSWLLAMTEPKHDDDPFDRCNDDCCQRYQGIGALTAAALDAVRATRGEVLLTPARSEPGASATGQTERAAQASAQPSILDANYSKSCGGVSELARYVWGADKPGISAVVDAPPTDGAHGFFPVTDQNLEEYLEGDWLDATRAYCSPSAVSPSDFARYLGRVDETDDYFRWTVQYDRDELEALLRDKLSEARELAAVRDVQVVERGVSGRAARLEIEWEDSAGKVITTSIESEYEIRRVLHKNFLYSSAIALRAARDDAGRIETLKIRGAGWGHGAGLCQIGALGMALSGIDYRSICKHYYPDAHLERIYD